jgi:hypothetical protein
LACQDDYITIDRSTTSRSGLYATDLPGVDSELFSGLIKVDQSSTEDIWENIYSRAWENLISDVTKLLQDKFYVDLKLITRETSEFEEDVNSETGLAGIKLEFDLPKYGRIHIISVSVFSEEAYPSPGIHIGIYDTDENGELLFVKDASIEDGRNTINIDRDFDTNKLFVSYDPSTYQLRQTKNIYFPLGRNGWSHWDKISCTWPCAWGGEGSVRQFNGGGLNVKYVVYCSVEKYVCENINLFKKAFWYRLGLEITIERRFGNRLNEFTTMTIERATELFDFFNAQYQQDLSNVINPLRNSEDPICFNCKSTVTAKSNIP